MRDSHPSSGSNAASGSLSDAMLDRYLAGECTPVEAAEVRRWLASVPGGEALPSFVAAMSVHEPHLAVPPAQVERQWDLVSRQLDQSDHHQSDHDRSQRDRSRGGAFSGTRWAGRGIAVAGFALAGLIAAVIAIGSHSTSTPSTARHFTTRPGERLAITLDDGSRVTLAPQTRMTVAANFGRDSREIDLVGEAHFDVRQQTVAPFEIHAGNTVTRVLGTTFIVRRYATDLDTRVSVTTGRVSTHAPRASTTLSAGQMAVVTDSAITAALIADAPIYTDYERGTLVFQNVPVGEVLSALGHWYGYEFRLTDTTRAATRVSMTLKMSDLTQVVAVLRSMLDVTAAFDHTRRDMPIITLSPQRESGHRSRMPTRTEPFTPTMEMGR